MITFRQANKADLDTINAIIEQAIMQWDLPERVKRLSLPSYFYNQVDFQHLDFLLAEQDQQVIAVAAWEAAELKDTPQQQPALLLHGLYVLPGYQRRGIATQLLQQAIQATRERGFAGLLVKAQADAVEFFHKQGMQPLPVENETRDYTHRLWWEIDHQKSTG